MNNPVTKRDLATTGMDALDRDRVGQVTVVSGGVSFATALEVMEFAKLLSTAGTAIPLYLRANPGGCLAVTFQAIEWRFSPLAVANKSYEVNDRIGYESQLIHAVIESRAPLKERLNCNYEGEGPERVCIVTGIFLNDSTREYRSPKFKDIRIKNSPLWKDDPDQQQWYYASRSWCRKWCPDVILGVYTRDELASTPAIGREEEPTGPNLLERLANADRSQGHNPTKAATELENVEAGSKVEILPPEEPKAAKNGKPRRRFRKGLQEAQDAPEPAKGTPEREIGQHATQQAQAEPEPPEQPTNAAEYIAYASRWIDKETDPDNAMARWDGEDQMRNDFLVPVRARITLRNKVNDKFQS